MRRNVFGWSTANLLVLVFALFPVFWLLMLSLKTPATIADGRLIPSAWTLDNYKGIFDQQIFTRALVNSIGIGLISTAIAIVLATMAAYAITRLDFPGKRALLTLPLAIWTLSAFFREIPRELEEAAEVDGATPFQALVRVIAPLAAPGIFTTMILVFIFPWNDFLFAFSLTATDAAQTVPAAIALFPGASQFTQPTGSIAAAAIVVTVPIIVMVMIFQRRIVAGLTAGAVKG